MIGIEDLLSADNQSAAMLALQSKPDGSGPDGLRISEFEDYWKANRERIENSIRNGSYKPGIAKIFEIASGTGKRREVASINVVDRFIERLLLQQFRREVEPRFLTRSFAYQQGKGTLDAAILARDYIEQGYLWLCEIDIKDFFGTINLDAALDSLKKFVLDNQTVSLVDRFLHREVEREGKIKQVRRGLLQGSPISPLISNIYLHPLDQHLESAGYDWIRYADNIYVFTRLRQNAEEAYDVIRGRLSIHHRLEINEKKSGIYNSIDRRILGYEFVTADGGIEVRKHHRKPPIDLPYLARFGSSSRQWNLPRRPRRHY